MFPRSPTYAIPRSCGRWLNVLQDGHRAMPLPARESHACAQYQQATRTSAEPRRRTQATSTGRHSNDSPQVGHPMIGRPSVVNPTWRYVSPHGSHSLVVVAWKMPSQVGEQNASNGARGTSQPRHAFTRPPRNDPTARDAQAPRAPRGEARAVPRHDQAQSGARYRPREPARPHP